MHFSPGDCLPWEGWFAEKCGGMARVAGGTRHLFGLGPPTVAKARYAAGSERIITSPDAAIITPSTP